MSSSLQPTTEPLASLPLRVMQPSTVCADCYIGFEDSCLNVCWAEDGHLPWELGKTPNPDDNKECRKGGTIHIL